MFPNSIIRDTVTKIETFQSNLISLFYITIFLITKKLCKSDLVYIIL